MKKLHDMGYVAYLYVQKNLVKILLVIVTYMTVQYLMTLPYINLLQIYVSYLPLILALVILVISLRPKKEIILMTGLVLFGLSYPFLLFKINIIAEVIGNISYLFIAAYLITCIKELRS